MDLTSWLSFFHSPNNDCTINTEPARGSRLMRNVGG